MREAEIFFAPPPLQAKSFQGGGEGKLAVPPLSDFYTSLNVPKEYKRNCHITMYCIHNLKCTAVSGSNVNKAQPGQHCPILKTGYRYENQF